MPARYLIGNLRARCVHALIAHPILQNIAVARAVALVSRECDLGRLVAILLIDHHILRNTVLLLQGMRRLCPLLHVCSGSSVHLLGLGPRIRF